MRHFYVFTLALLITPFLFAQDPHFSQYYLNPLNLSPSLTGTGFGSRIVSTNRLQWVNIPYAYKTFSLTYDQPFQYKNTYHGIGASYLIDIAGEGPLINNTLLLNYAYHIKIHPENKHFLTLGTSFGITHSYINYDNLTFSNDFDNLGNYVRNPNNPKGTATKINENINAGATYYNRYLYFGFSFYNLTQPSQTFSTGKTAQKPLRTSLFTGLNIPLTKNDSISLNPYILFRKQSVFEEFNAGINLKINPLTIGVGFRKNDAYLFLIGYNLKTNFGLIQLFYSYDHTYSTLTNKSSGGSHECSIIWQLFQNKANKIPFPPSLTNAPSYNF